MSDRMKGQVYNGPRSLRHSYEPFTQGEKASTSDSSHSAIFCVDQFYKRILYISVNRNIVDDAISSAPPAVPPVAVLPSIGTC